MHVLGDRMNRRLPAWAWWATGGLAFLAGSVNVVGMLGLGRQALTHVSGSVSKLATAVANGDSEGVGSFAIAVGAFILGATVSGMIVGNIPRRLGRPQALVFFMESVLLGAAALLLGRAPVSGICCAAAACGLQNGAVSLFGGFLFRTTHLTGMATDLGIAVGHRLRGFAVDKNRLMACIVVGLGFLIGGIVGAWVYAKFGFGSLYLPAGLAAVAGAAIEFAGPRDV